MPGEVSWHDACQIDLPLPLHIVARMLHALAMEFPEASVRIPESGRMIVRVKDDDDE